jgi:hypothetical protein
MLYSTKARLLLAGAALSICASPAFALDGNDLIAKINAALVIQGGALTAESVAVNGSTVTLTGAAFNPSGSPKKFALGTVTMEGVEEDGGGYSIDKVVFPNVNASKDNTTITVSDIAMSGVTVPADTSSNTLDSLLLYEEAHIGPVNVALDGKTVFSVGEANMTTAVADDNSGIDFGLKLEKLNADLSVTSDPQALETITDLGLTTINGTVTLTGGWTQNDGTVAIEEYSIDLDKVGKLNLSASLSGYTIDFIKSAQETAKAMEANANKQEAQQAANLAMLGLLQRLTFNSAQIRFDDAGITKRGLDYAGKKQGASGEQMAQMIKAMTPLALAQYNIPELQNMLSVAVNTYLDKPENLTVTAEPANPVPFPMIMGAAMGAPNTLPKVLGVKVNAND